MKKVLFLAAVALAANTVIGQEKTAKPALQSAQGIERVGGARDPQKVAEMKVNRLDKQVTLTDAQKKQATEIYLKTASVRPSMDPAEKQKLMEARNEEKAAIDKILTAQQKEKLEAVATERKARQEEAMQRRAQMNREGGAQPVQQKLAK